MWASWFLYIFPSRQKPHLLYVYVPAFALFLHFCIYLTFSKAYIPCFQSPPFFSFFFPLIKKRQASFSEKSFSAKATACPGHQSSCAHSTSPTMFGATGKVKCLPPWATASVLEGSVCTSWADHPLKDNRVRISLKKKKQILSPNLYRFFFQEFQGERWFWQLRKLLSKFGNTNLDTIFKMFPPLFKERVSTQKGWSRIQIISQASVL